MGYTYNPETGEITSHKGKIIDGKRAGYIMLGFRIDEKIYNVMGHRFAYWFYYDVIADNIDHINRVRNDNRICNLRNVSKQQNNFNKTDTKGFYYNKLAKKYQAHIRLNNKLKNLGYYQTEAEARASYLAAKKIYHII
jgi:hypothetical protein